jgi:hypothetical protein
MSWTPSAPNWGRAMGRLTRRVLFWLVENVPLGRAAPWVLGLALGSVPHRVVPLRRIDHDDPLAWMDETPMRDFHDDCGDR